MRVAGFLALVVFFIISCSGSGASVDGGERVRNTVRATLGTSSADHIVRVSEDVLMIRNGYQFERRIETAEDVRLETSWREFSALDDEKALGWGFVRIRITVRARPRDRSAGTYAATFNAEIEGRGPTGDIWAKIPITEQRDGYFENEFKGGVRPGGRND